MQEFLHCVTRMTTSHQSGSFADQRTQDADYCSLSVGTSTLPSITDSTGIKSFKCKDLHVGVNDVEICDKTVDQCNYRDECTSITLIAYCLAQYISTLDVQHRKHVQSQISSDTVSWISQLFR